MTPQEVVAYYYEETLVLLQLQVLAQLQQVMQAQAIQLQQQLFQHQTS
jgi:hypothetical protein